MKKTLFILLLTIVSLSSCTHNNGDIGPLFGQWKVLEITIDGNSDVDYEGNLFLSFQNDVVAMAIVYEHHDRFWRYGKWVMYENTLEMYFDIPEYPPVPESHFLSGVNICNVESFDSESLVFTTNIEGVVYKYTLKKWR